MPRRVVEPDPAGWWARYGHRLSGSRTAPPGHGRGPAARPEEHTVTGEGSEGSGTGTAGELRDEVILRGRPDHATRGWRRFLRVATAGLAKPGPGQGERAERARLHRIRQPVDRPQRVAVASIKGGVGKTTVTSCLGLVLAEHRGDRVIALDANPDAGTLAERLTGESNVTVRDLIRDLEKVTSWTDLSRYLSLGGRLQVLASEQDPAASEAFSRDEYERVCAVLGRYFNVIITDSGTGLVHSAMEGTLALADSLIVVGAPTVDGASRASKTLDWLGAHAHGALVNAAVVVLSSDRTSAEIDRSRIRQHFAARTRAVVEVPFDPHLATGGRIELGQLRPPTREAFYDLAALVADGFVPAAPIPTNGTFGQ
jgi:MinD-like ATPase involved in chromosome partitioning or flagellar assembly